jgi:hypothetical protein
MKHHGWKPAIAVSLMLIAPSSAAAVRLTMYDDGLSCPSDCDAHVVFDERMNGTEFAHDPASANGPLQRCSLGKPCRLCIEPGAQECFVTTYRGGGPAENTFDLTPAFFEQNCPTLQHLAALKAKCAEIAVDAARLNDRINCIRDSSAAACTSIMDAAIQARDQDRPVFEECRQRGQAAFNAGRPQAEQRSLGCAYEAVGTGGPNSNGKTWKKLLPGACRPGTFVGRDGLDCCSGNLFADGHLGRECSKFYPQR